MNKWDCTVTVC